MARFTRFAVAALALAAFLATVHESRAAVTVLNLWELGENDPGAASGLLGNPTTIAAAGGQTLNRSGTPQYTGNTVAVGSTLAMDFVGNGNYNVSPVFNTLTDNFGIEAWVQADAFNAGTNSLVAYNGNTSNAGWGIFRLGANYGALYGGRAVFGSGPATVGQWTHLAVVRNSGTSTFYVNGAATGSTGTVPGTPAGAFMIGGNLGGEYFDGRVDRVRVFSFAPGAFNPATDLLLQSVQVLGRYQLGEHDPGALAGQPGNLLTIDDTGTRNLNRVGGPRYVADTPGPGSYLAMDFTTASSGNAYLNSPVLTTAQNNWIIEAWVNADNTSGNALVAYNGHTGTAGFGLFRFGNEWGGLFGGIALLDFNVPVVLNDWTHLALVRDNGVTRMYVDGVAAATTFANTPNVPSGNFMIGGNVGGAEMFFGQIDDVRLSLFTGPFDPATMLNMNAALVPEPSSLALAGMGLVGLLAAGRRLRRRGG